MTQDRPYFEILTALIYLKKDFPTTQWYGFGSFFNGRGSFNDIDLLAVCPDEDEAATIRIALSDLTISWPIHLIIMTEVEAVETGFVIRQRCCLLTSPKM